MLLQQPKTCHDEFPTKYRKSTVFTSVKNDKAWHCTAQLEILLVWNIMQEFHFGGFRELSHH
jgi:hypothetical protein